jgi:hypothetical protein
MTFHNAKLAVVASLLAASAAVVSPVNASDESYCGNTPRAEWKSISQATAAVEAKGYQVREVERDDGCYEFEVSDQSGKRFELYVHPRTLDVVKTERKS